MEKIIHKENEKSVPKYTSVLKPALILLILLGNPQGFSMSSAKESIRMNEGSTEVQSNKQIIEEAIRYTLADLKTLDQLPKKIHYHNKQVHNVPDSIDIEPSKITKPVEGITLILGGRHFFIKPLFGNIQSISRKNNNLVLGIQAMGVDFSKEYSADKKIPELCDRLWNTPKGKGEKPGFIGTIVTEVTKK